MGLLKKNTQDKPTKSWPCFRRHMGGVYLQKYYEASARIWWRLLTSPKKYKKAPVRAPVPIFPYLRNYTAINWMFYSNRRLNLHIGEMVIFGAADTIFFLYLYFFLKTQFTEMAHLDDCFQGVCACGQRRIQDEEAPRRAPKRRQPQRKYVASAFPLPASPGYATVPRWAHIAVSEQNDPEKLKKKRFTAYLYRFQGSENIIFYAKQKLTYV